jgi:hypothetical protein
MGMFDGRLTSAAESISGQLDLLSAVGLDAPDDRACVVVVAGATSTPSEGDHDQ